MKVFRGFALTVLVAVGVWAQSAPKPAFEVASIKPSAPFLPGSGGALGLGVHIDGSQVRCTQLSLKEYIRMAYGLKDYQVAGPDWVTSERFDINAKVPEGTNRDQVRGMVQTLLADRFELKSHMEKREFPVYALTAAKGGVKMKESPLDPEGSGQVDVKASGSAEGTSISLGRGASFTMADNKLTGTKLSMPAMADMLARFLDRPVLDMTDTPGTYDFALEITPEDFRAMRIRSAIAAGISLPPAAIAYADAQSGDSLYTSLQNVGLKLERQKAPLDFLVIDHMLKAPSEN